MELYSDTYYIERIVAGETNCFACLVDRYNHALFQLIVRVVQCREEAEELTQDVWMKAFRHLSAFKGECKFSTWLYRIAYNTALSAVRKKKEQRVDFDESQWAHIPDEAVDSLLAETPEQRDLQALDRALTRLPDEECALIWLFYKEEKSIEEMAEISGLSASNVKVKLHRIRKKLAVLLLKERGA